MYGAILGDMIGAPYEFDMGDKTKTFPLFIKQSQFTDDTVMSIAIAEALMDTLGKDDESIRQACVKSMQKWGAKYPNYGYGLRFNMWLDRSDPKPYNSCGNGSAMRVSAAGWLGRTMDEVRRLARLSAEVTHNHIEGIKGAEATASAIFLARNGAGKKEIKDFIEQEFSYDLSRTCDQIRPSYHHVETCQETVPEAVTAFLEGNDFEDVIHTAVSLGGDCDTLTCIAGSIAEAFYGVPDALKNECVHRLSADLAHVLFRFESICKQNAGSKPENSSNQAMENDQALNNEKLEHAISHTHKLKTQESFAAVLESLEESMRNKGQFELAMVQNPLSETSSDISFEDLFGISDLNTCTAGDLLELKQDLSLAPMLYPDAQDGRFWILAFTSRKEAEKTGSSFIVNIDMKELMEKYLQNNYAGIIINGLGLPFRLTPDMLHALLDEGLPQNQISFMTADITEVSVDAIVNPTSSYLHGTTGLDGYIRYKAGGRIEQECAAHSFLPVGDSFVTHGWNLPARFVIHTAAPHYEPGSDSCKLLLKACYTNSLNAARKQGLHSIAFPAISTGHNGFPTIEAAQIALLSCAEWLDRNQDYSMAIVLVSRDEEAAKNYKMVLDYMHSQH